MSKKGKLKTEEKVRIIREYLEGRVSFSESVNRGGCSKWTFRQWVKRYKAEGIEAFMPHERNRQCSSELKLRAVQDYLNGNGSLMEISVRYKISDTHILRRWIRVYYAHQCH